MIAKWMLYAVVLGVAVSLVALAAEYALRLYGRPTRWLWATSLLTVLAVPLAAWFLAPVPEARAVLPLDFVVQPVGGELPGAPAVAPAPVPWSSRLLGLESRLDGALPWLWLAMSALSALGLALSYARLRRRRAGWREAEVDGVPVLLSEETGPAVVGLRRSRIVVPAWVLEEPEARRRLILAHEAEHLAAGDARLVTGALAALVAAPWNPAVWWQVRRLRLAAELDCDARVLRRGEDLRRYAGLLLDVGMRFGGGAAVAAFAEPRSFLARRLRLLTAPRPRRRGWRVAAGLLGALAVTGVAWSAPRPSRPATAPAREAAAPQEPSPRQPWVLMTARGLERPALLNGEQLGVMIRDRYPGLNATGQAGLLVHVGPEGRVTEWHVGSPTGTPELDSVAVLVAKAARFQRPRMAANEELWLDMWVKVAPDAGTPTFVAALITPPGGPTLQPPALPQDTPVTPSFTPHDVAPELVNRNEIVPGLAAAYPPLLKSAGIGGLTDIWLLVGQDGRVQRWQLKRSSGYAELDSAALKVGRQMRFTPGRLKGTPVPVWIQLPIQFKTAGAVGPQSGAAPAGVKPGAPGAVRDTPVIRRDAQGTPYDVAPQTLNASEVNASILASRWQTTNAANARLRIRVSETGAVTDVTLVESSGNREGDSLAIATAKLMHLSPARYRGKPVAVTLEMPGNRPQPPREQVLQGPVFTPFTVAPELDNREEVRRALVREYPPELKAAGVGGTVQIWLLIDEQGGVAQSRVKSSGGRAELDTAAVRVGRMMHFRPGLNRERPVMVWVALPIIFKTTSDPPMTRPSYDYSGLPKPDSRFGVPGLPEGYSPPSPGMTSQQGDAYAAAWPRDAKLTGPAWIRVTVSAQGEASGFALAKSSGDARADEVALSFAKLLRYQPATDAQRKPVTTTVVLPFPAPVPRPRPGAGPDTARKPTRDTAREVRPQAGRGAVIMAATSSHWGRTEAVASE